jgi:hypothetical protein
MNLEVSEAPADQLTSVGCTGYRAFAMPTSLPLRRLTVIFGRNNSGKTTLARLPLFVAESLGGSPDLYALTGGGLRFGSSFRSLASADQPHPRVRVGAEWASGSLAVELLNVNATGASPRVIPAEVHIDDVAAGIAPPDTTSDRQHGRDHVLAALSEVMAGRFEERCRWLAGLARASLHVPGARDRVAEVYPSRDPTDWSVAEFPFLLAQNEDLLGAVGEWCTAELDGLRIYVDHGTFAFRIAGRYRDAWVSLAQAGRGTQAIIPVATLLIAIEQKLLRPRLVVVEEPEEHLHPSAHGGVADLLIRCAQQAQTIVETHSENLVLRLRRRIAEGVLTPDDVSLCYIGVEGEVRRVRLDQTGAAIDWPTGVFEEGIEEANVMVKARLGAMGLTAE